MSREEDANSPDAAQLQSERVARSRVVRGQIDGFGECAHGLLRAALPAERASNESR